MRALSISSRCFACAAAVLLGGVATLSVPSAALAGDDNFACPGSRCTGRQTPTCCLNAYRVGDMIEQDFYYFPNAA